MINLLPLLEKKELQEERRLKVVLILGIVICIFFVFLFLVLLGVRIYAWGELGAQKSISSTEQTQNSEIESMRKIIDGFNNVFLAESSFYSQQQKLTPLFNELSNALPGGLYINKASWTIENSQVSISGFSSSRDALFEFKNNLEKNQGLSEVYFPPINWIKPRDIDFRVTFKIK